MNWQPTVLARHDCERMPGSAWLAQLTTEIRTRDAQEGLLLPLAAAELATTEETDAVAGIAWLMAIATRTMAASEAGEESLPADRAAIPSDDDARAVDTDALADHEFTAEDESAPLHEQETAEESAQSQLQRARQHARDGDLSAALAAYATLLPAGPGLAPCAEDLAALAQVQPRDAAIHQILGDVQRARGRLEDACASYQRALAALSHEESVKP